jgi:phosphoglycerate dehydrogenase-like enzyme
LQTLVIPWTGLPVKTRALLEGFPHLAVHNLHHNATTVAELAIALLLAAAKSVVPLDRALRRDDWTPRYQPSESLLLAGKTCLILGYGAIGQRVAEVCRALGMTVLAIRRQANHGDGIAHEIHPPSALTHLLPQAQALMICLPHTAATDGLIGEAELALLPTDCILVNIGRGPIVDETALYTALSEGRLKGAGLDVWYRYPADVAGQANTAPSRYPFGEFDNVVMSPHRGGHVIETETLRMEGLAELLNLAAGGEPIPNPVDLEQGY